MDRIGSFLAARRRAPGIERVEHTERIETVPQEIIEKISDLTSQTLDLVQVCERQENMIKALQDRLNGIASIMVEVGEEASKRVSNG